jgi:CBS domain-containing protein/sporulation protein YlmC with PRC-barrel domain
MTAISSRDVFGAEKLYQLSDLRKRPVYHNDQKIGWLADLVIEDKDIVAEVTHVRVGRPFGNPPYYVPWVKVKSLSLQGVVLDPALDLRSSSAAPPGAVLLDDYIVDKKVLDVAGREVEVVYDVTLAIIRIHLYVIAVDFSRYSLLRRLGLGWLAKAMYGGRQPAVSQAVAWNLVEPLPHQLGSFVGDIKLKLLKEELAEMPPVDMARVMEELSHDQRLAILEGLEPSSASEALEELDPKTQRELIPFIPKDKAARLIDEMTPGQAADVLAALPASAARAILELMDPHKSGRVQAILDEHEALISDYLVPEVVKVLPGSSVLEARRQCRQTRTRDAVACAYVVDAEDRLIGVVDAIDLLRASEETLLQDIMKENVVTLNRNGTLKEASETFARYGFHILPVTDPQRKLLGIVPYRDVMNLKHRYLD